MPRPLRVEYAGQRKIRARNKALYRLAHWPIWIWVFFLSPGPMVFDLFAYGPSRRTLIWLAVVLAGTGIAGLFGKLPGVEPAPYILRFTEDKPNPLYRRICYTFAWNVVLNFALLNLAGLLAAVATGHWYLKQIYAAAYFPLAVLIWGLGAFGLLPRVMKSTAGEGVERRYFYGAVWTACAAQPTLGVLWHVLPRARWADLVKLAAFLAVIAGMTLLAVEGRLPRTRRILPGEPMVAD